MKQLVQGQTRPPLGWPPSLPPPMHVVCQVLSLPGLRCSCCSAVSLWAAAPGTLTHNATHGVNQEASNFQRPSQPHSVWGMISQGPSPLVLRPLAVASPKPVLLAFLAVTWPGTACPTPSPVAAPLLRSPERTSGVFCRQTCRLLEDSLAQSPIWQRDQCRLPAGVPPAPLRVAGGFPGTRWGSPVSQ